MVRPLSQRPGSLWLKKNYRGTVTHPLFMKQGFHQKVKSTMKGLIIWKTKTFKECDGRAQDYSESSQVFPTAAASQGSCAKCVTLTAAHEQWCGEPIRRRWKPTGIFAIKSFRQLHNHTTPIITYTIRRAHPASKSQPISFLPTHSGSITNSKCTTAE